VECINLSGACALHRWPLVKIWVSFRRQQIVSRKIFTEIPIYSGLNKKKIADSVFVSRHEQQPF
jgi:hypothetical protein